ncbi:hypothetical protein [Neisseria chenwenguii]|uniref:hypothetical protein n=1 Tax=Neisseria chenwenguii TaxID=1853278 RepID=UPI0018DF09AA|nr:hypothetical protein [Neisseria chenwenguii]
MKEAGFHVVLNYIGLTAVDLYIERVRSRIRNGGHPIDEAVVRKRFAESRANLAEVVKLADEVYLYDNSGNKPKLTVYVSDGLIFPQSGNIPEWAAEFVEQPKAV